MTAILDAVTEVRAQELLRSWEGDVVVELMDPHEPFQSGGGGGLVFADLDLFPLSIVLCSFLVSRKGKMGKRPPAKAQVG